jgi:hypothetical protein
MSCDGEMHYAKGPTRAFCGLWVPANPFSPAGAHAARQVTDRPGAVTCKTCRRILDLLAAFRSHIDVQ